MKTDVNQPVSTRLHAIVRRTFSRQSPAESSDRYDGPAAGPQAEEAPSQWAHSHAARTRCLATLGLALVGIPTIMGVVQPLMSHPQNVQPATPQDNMGGPPQNLQDTTGPVLVTTVDHTLTDPSDAACIRGNSGGLVYGAQDLLGKVSAAGVPIVYVTENPTADAALLKELPRGNVVVAQKGQEAAAIRSAAPHARLFELGNDGAQDAAAFQTAGGHAYILNVQPDHANIPAGFKPVITDNFTDRFQNLVMADLHNAQQGLGPTEADWQPAPASPKQTMLQKTEKSWAPFGNWVAGVPQEAAHAVEGMYNGAGSAHKTIQSTSADARARMSTNDLATLATRVMKPGMSGLSTDTLSQDFMTVITSHGRDAASVDQILTMVPNGRQADQWMTGPAKTEFQQLRQSQQAVRGDWAGFDTYVDHATGTTLRPGTKVEPLINGSTAFPAMIDAIKNAHTSVNYSVYDFQSDETGWDMARALVQAAQHVPVKVLYDPVGSANTNGAPTDPAIYKYMQDHGVVVEQQKTGALHLTHRKLLVVDGSVGFIGGMNVGNEYRDTWHDVNSRVTGPGVADMQHLFVEQWQRDGYHVSPSDMHTFFPSLQAVDGAGPARIIGHVGRQDQAMKLAYLRAIDTAKDSINIATPYFSDPDVSAHLQAAARNGVTVRLFLPKTTDNAQIKAIEQSMYPALIASGVQVYEYDGNPMAHEKVATFDGHVSTIGSSNLDMFSLDTNDEANVWSNDATVAQTLDQNLFGRDLAHARRITSWNPTQQQAAQGNILSKAMHTLSPFK